MAARKKSTRAKATPRKTTRKTAARVSKNAAQKLASDVARRSQELDKVTVKLIQETATSVQKHIHKRRKPDLSFPIRSP